jgi:hypothetical protein
VHSFAYNLRIADCVVLCLILVLPIPQPEELFDDLEAEFTLDKPKTKKPSQQAFGAGGGAGGQAGLKAVPGLGGGKSAADEVGTRL